MALLVARGRWLNSGDLLPAILVVLFNARLQLNCLMTVRREKRQDRSSSLEGIELLFNVIRVKPLDSTVNQKVCNASLVS
jgi:hypothetical protein